MQRWVGIVQGEERRGCEKREEGRWKGGREEVERRRREGRGKKGEKEGRDKGGRKEGGKNRRERKGPIPQCMCE